MVRYALMSTCSMSHATASAVPSPPRSLLDRLKFLEDHIVHLEKEYPPWAALHFNQPNRGVRILAYSFRIVLDLAFIVVAASASGNPDYRSLSSHLYDCTQVGACGDCHPNCYACKWYSGEQHFKRKGKGSATQYV